MIETLLVVLPPTPLNETGDVLDVYEGTTAPAMEFTFVSPSDEPTEVAE